MGKLRQRVRLVRSWSLALALTLAPCCPCEIVCVGGPHPVIWGYLKASQAPGTAHAQASEGCFTRTWLPVCFPPKRDCFAVALASLTSRSESVPSHPACQGAPQEAREQAGRLPGSWSSLDWGQAISHFFVCPSNTCLSAYCVPITVLDTGDSLSLGGAHATLFSILVISPRVGASGF